FMFWVVVFVVGERILGWLFQDESNLDFVVEVVSLFFYDSKKLLNDLTMAFIGAQRVKNACIAFCNFFEEQNIA
ncbi:hypothetical protein QQP08_002820, partial [Theobroma cacao]